MRIGLAVIGRPFNPDPEADGLVRNEPAILLKELAERHPDHEWEAITRHTDEEPDRLIVWLAGGFAAMRQDTPRLDGSPQKYRRTLSVYVQPIADILQRTRPEPVWIVNDPRAYFRARDVPKPSSILSQHAFEKKGVRYHAAGMDIAGVPWYPEVRKRLGTINPITVVASVTGKHGRREAIERWGVLNLYPQRQLQYAYWLKTTPETILFPPSSRSRWITAKFWECAANGVIPWMAEGYDSQDVSGVDRMGMKFLRVKSKDELYNRRVMLFEDPEKAVRARKALRLLYERRFDSRPHITAIEARLGPL
jgi:hypothetical protein